MFNFTTTNVINSNVDLSTGKALWTIGSNNIFRVKRVGNFKKENVTAIYKTTGYNGVCEKITINLASLTATENDTLRLYIYVGLTQACQDSRYSNDFYTKGKPFSVDFPYLDKGKEGTETAKNLEKIINKYLVFVFGEKLLDVKAEGATIIITAKNEYQRFKEVRLEKFEEPSEANLYGKYTLLKDLKAIKTEGGFVAGKEGFGTYSYILHNLRIPTSMRTRTFGINQEESPIPGALYDEYVIHYSTNRGTLGMNGVGDQVRSNTTHVFYVKQGLTATPLTKETINKKQVEVGNKTFDKAIGELGEIISMDTPEIPTGDPNPITDEATINDALSKKADKTYVEQELAKKQNIA